MRRPLFAKMLGQIRDGETLVMTKLDRSGRDALDVGATIKMLAEHRIEAVVLQLGKLDLTRAAGKLILTMLAAVAEMERDLLVERTYSGLEREGGGRDTRAQAENDRATAPGDQGRARRRTSVSALAREYDIGQVSILNIVA